MAFLLASRLMFRLLFFFFFFFFFKGFNMLKAALSFHAFILLGLFLFWLSQTLLEAAVL